jgi:serine/threonine-protein kinase HipA
MSGLCVWWGNRQVGSIDLHDGNPIFTYAQPWLEDPGAPAISVSLPKQPAPFSRSRTEYFFSGLLPDEDQRLLAARRLGLSERNTFGLLTALGGDVAGALTLLPEGQMPARANSLLPPNPLDEAGLAAVIAQLPVRPFLTGPDGALEGVRVSLAGAQSKLPVVVQDGAICLPRAGEPTTHILKPAMPRFAFPVENEAFSMRLSAALGLPTAPVSTGAAGGQAYLLVTRYDRRTAPLSGRVRLHQEDFCQALGIAPWHKYASEGGPTLDQCSRLIRSVSAAPAVDIAVFLRAVLVNMLVGNADAHGKNFSLLYLEEGLRLAPLYDLLCTVAWPEVSPRMAMRFGDARSLDEVEPQTWPTVATQLGVTRGYLVQQVRSLIARLPAALSATLTGLADPWLDISELARLATLVRSRSDMLIASLPA